MRWHKPHRGLGRGGSERVVMGGQGARRMPGLLAWMEGEVGFIEGSTPQKQRPPGEAGVHFDWRKEGQTC